jgi:hypothetical protein
MCVSCGFFFAWSAGRCMPKNPDWGEEYGLKFQCTEEGHHNDLVSRRRAARRGRLAWLRVLAAAARAGAGADALRSGAAGPLGRCAARCTGAELGAHPHLAAALAASSTRGSRTTPRHASHAQPHSPNSTLHGPRPTPTPLPAPACPQATLFLSSNHHTIINLFSIGHEPGQPFIMHFTKGSLVCYLCVYIVLMSVGAGVAIPGGLFMPSLIVGSAWGALFGMQLREWLPGWNIQPGVYALMAGTGGRAALGSAALGWLAAAGQCGRAAGGQRGGPAVAARAPRGAARSSRPRLASADAPAPAAPAPAETSPPAPPAPCPAAVLQACWAASSAP